MSLLWQRKNPWDAILKKKPLLLGGIVYHMKNIDIFLYLLVVFFKTILRQVLQYAENSKNLSKFCV